MNAQEPEVSISAHTNFTIIPNGVIGSDVSDRAFRVYVTLRAFVRPGHNTFPKITTVGERFGMSESYIKRGISELREKGMLNVEKRHYSGGFRKVNSYFFPDISDLPEGGKFDPSERVTATDRPGVADLTPPREEEKQEEEKLEVLSSEVANATPRPEVESLCILLADLIEANGSKRPTTGKRWSDACRLMLDRDGYTAEQVEWMIRWTQNDEFWKTNILSMPKLREKFDQLKLKVKAEKAVRPATEDRMAEILAIGENLESNQQRQIGA